MNLFKSIYTNYLEPRTPKQILIAIGVVAPLLGGTGSFWYFVHDSKVATVLLASLSSLLALALSVLLYLACLAYASLLNRLNESAKNPEFIPKFGVLWKKHLDVYNPYCPSCSTLMSLSTSVRSSISTLTCTKDHSVTLRYDNSQPIYYWQALEFLKTHYG